MAGETISYPRGMLTVLGHVPRLLAGVLCVVVAAAACAEPPGNVQSRLKSPAELLRPPSSCAMRQSRAVTVTEVAPNALSTARAITEAVSNGISPTEAGTLPTAMDNSTLMYFPPIKQQTAGDCTCYASAYYYNTFLQARDEGLDASGGDPDVICSPRFLFLLIAQGSWGAECTEHAMARLSEVGCANVSFWDYEEDVWGPFPTEAAWVQGLKNRTGTLYEIAGSSGTDIDIEAIKTVLANGSCVVTRADFGANYTAYRDYASGYGIDNRVMYKRDYAWHGNRHSMCIVGYDDNKSYYDDRDSTTHYGAFILANSEGQTSDWYNSTETGTKGFMWIAYRMFLDLGSPINQAPEFGYYDWEGIGESPCFDNEDYPTVYYHDDRPQHRPSLYAVAGINHVDRNRLRFTGGVGSTGSPDFTGPDAVEQTDSGTATIDDSRRVAVDLSDGVGFIVPGVPKQVFVQLDVNSLASSNGTITSADFYYDFDGNGIYQTIASTDPTVTVTPGTSGFATVTISLPAPIYVDDSNVTGPWTGTRDHPYQTIQDGIDNASAHGTVYVLPGTYNEAVVMGEKLSLIGAGAEVTLIDSQNAGEAMFCNGVADVLIDGFTLTSSGTTYNAFRSLDSTVMVRDCVAADSRSGFGAGNTGSLKLKNCMTCDNSHQGVFQSGSPTVTLQSTTVVDNGDNGVVRWGSGLVTIVNSIITGNTDDIDGATGGFDVSYCDIGDGDFAGSDGNISLDPLFVSGPYHDRYLSQTAAGQGSESPCFDTGSAGAWNCGLDDRTTRTDAVCDEDQVDMGYHAGYPLAITDVYWDQATTSVVLVFASEPGVDYTVESAEANAYSDGVSWSDLITPVTATGILTTVTDDLSTNPLTNDYRFYRVKRADDTETSQQTAALFELDLDVSFVVRQFFVSTPLIPDADYADVADVLSTQLDYTGARVDRLIADSGLYLRATYTPGVGWADTFPIVAGEGYWLNVGNAIPVTHALRLTGYVTEDPVVIPVTRDSFAVTRRWMAYSMPQATTLAGLGLETAITPFWAPTNEVRMLPLGTTAWKRYFFDGTNWREGSISGPLADSTPIVCGQGLLFIHNGAPGQPDTLTCATWYMRPPNVW